MLTTIREKTQGIIATFILALIGIPFALWGINSYFEGGSRAEIADVNGEQISEQAYRARLENLRRQLDQRMASTVDIKRVVIDSMVDENLLVRDAQEQGYRIDNDRLASTIRQLPYFQSGGQFDPKLYESLLRREGVGMREFENQRRAETVTTQVRYGYSASGIVTESEVAALLKLLLQEREIATAVVGVEKFQAAIPITAEAVAQYHSAHADLFRTQEQVRIEFLKLSAQDLIKDYQPSDAELRSAYADETSKRAAAESRRAAHILIPLPKDAVEADAKKALAKAQDIEKQARAGADFAKLARTYSDDKDSAAKGGDLGEIKSGTLPKPLEDAVFSLKPGQISQPVRTQYGYHLAKVTALKTSAQKPFQEMKPLLVKQLRQRKGEERFYEASEKFRNLIYEQSESLAPAAETLGLKIESTDWFGRAGGASMAAHPRVVEVAFSPEVLTQGRNSDAVEVSGDTLVAIRVAGHRPVTLKPVADVRPQIERALRQEGAEKAGRELGEKLVKELASGGSLEAAARKYGLMYQPPKKLLRDLPQGVDKRVVEAAFRSRRPDAGQPGYGGVELGSKGYAVYAVSRVVDGDPAKADAAIKDKAKRLLETRRGPDYYANYSARLKQKAEIKIFQDRL